jgi:hypothetical protein
LIFLILLGPGSSHGKSSATIVFSGDMRGYIQPCPT